MLPYHTPYVRILSFCFYNRDPAYDSNYYSPICWELTLNKRQPKDTFTLYLMFELTFRQIVLLHNEP